MKLIVLHENGQEILINPTQIVKIGTYENSRKETRVFVVLVTRNYSPGNAGSEALVPDETLDQIKEQLDFEAS